MSFKAKQSTKGILFVSWLIFIFNAIIVCMFLSSCNISSPDKKNEIINLKSSVVTSDIQANIEKHIKEQVLLGNGYFKILHENKELSLKLVRIHTEYLATLGSRSYFACVDLADINGDVYDVDFFLSGDPGLMIVTETFIHKLNGQPYYVWKQNPDHTWERVSMDKADSKLLGIITGIDKFDFIYQATLPDITNSARIWIPIPSTDSYQKVKIKSINTPEKYTIIEEREYGNKILYMELSHKNSGEIIELCFEVERLEKAPYTSNPDDSPLKYLTPERLVPIDGDFTAISKKITDGKNSDLEKARALYDHVIDRVKYIKNGKGWGNGDAVYACSAGSGNCTDFHSYFIALSRASGIPSRFAIGASIPSERNNGGIDGYHCWAEFFADNKWWPVDISEADKFTGLSSYYFGHHPANRLELSRGRDLKVEPQPAAGPINFLAYPLMEIASVQIKIKTEFFFNRKIKPTTENVGIG